MSELKEKLEREMAYANLKMTLFEISETRSADYMSGWLDGYSYADNDRKEKEQVKGQNHLECWGFK